MSQNDLVLSHSALGTLARPTRGWAVVTLDVDGPLFSRLRLRLLPSFLALFFLFLRLGLRIGRVVTFWGQKRRKHVQNLCADRPRSLGMRKNVQILRADKKKFEYFRSR